MVTNHSLEAAAPGALRAIIEAARAAAYPVAVAIVDSHGNLIAAQRSEGCRPRWMRASLRKSYTAAVMDRDTDNFHDEIVRRAISLVDYGDPMFTSLPGGLVVTAPSGETIAGIGVTGPTKGRDEEFARVGIPILVAAASGEAN